MNIDLFANIKKLTPQRVTIYIKISILITTLTSHQNLK